MPRLVRTLAVLAALAAAAIFGLPVMSAVGDPEDPAEVKGLRAGTAELAGWLGNLQSEGPLGQKLPGLQTTLGTGLDLQARMATLKAAIAGTSATGVQDLATKISALGSNSLQITTTGVDADGPVTGFDITVAATRAVAAQPLRLSVPATSSTPQTDLESKTGQGVPLDLAVSATFKVHYDADRDAFYVDAGSATPQLSGSARVANQALGNGFTAAMGFGDLKLDTGSKFDLDARLTAKVTDSNGDGRLAFTEPGNPTGATQRVDAELRLPATQNVAFTPAGTSTATVGFDSPYTAADDAVTMTLAGGPFGSAAPTIGGADAAELAHFGHVSGVEVLSGLVSYATAMRAVQANPNADALLPLMSGRLSDVVQAQQGVATFIDAHTQRIGAGETIQDATDFHTVGELVSRLEATPANKGLAGLQDTNGAAPGKLSPAYDPATDRLTFDLKFETEKATAPIEQPAAGPNGEQTATVGLPQIGGQLAPFTGINSLGTATADPKSLATSATALKVHLPFVIDLRDAVPAEDDPATEGIAEFEQPMPGERYALDTSGTDEIKVTADVDTPVADSGTIGFVRFQTATTSELSLKRADTTEPTIAIDVDATRPGLPAVVSISRLLRNLVDEDGDTANDPVAPTTPNWRLDGTLLEDARGPSAAGDADDYRLTEEPGTVTIAWPDATQPLAAGDVTLDGTAEMLKALDVDPAEPQALLGRSLDQFNGLLDEYDGIFETEPLLDEDIPFLGTSARDLFAASATLTEQVNAVRAVPPATLQDLELALQDAIGEELELTADERRSLVSFSVANLGDAASAPELIVRIDMTQATEEDRPVNLDLDEIGVSLAGDANGGTVHIDGETNFKLAFPVSLAATAPEGLQVLDSSGFEVTTSAADEDGSLELDTSVGPLEFTLGDEGSLHAGVAIGGYPAGAPVDEADEQPVSMAAFIDSLEPTVGSAEDGGSDCEPNDDVSVHGDVACMAMPVYVEGDPINGGEPLDADNFIELEVADDLTPTVTLPEGLDTDLLAEKALNIGSLKDGVDKLEAVLALALDGASYGAKLPLIGDQLAAGAEIITPVHDLVVAFKAFAEDPEWTAGQLNNKLRKLVFDALDVTGVLKDSDYEEAGAFPGDEPGSEVNDTDVRVLMLCGDDFCDPDDSFAEITQLGFNFEMGMGDPGQCATNGGSDCPEGTDLPLDFGIPGLSISGPDPSVKPLTATTGWSLGMGFGVDSSGFYLEDDPLPANGGDAEDPEEDTTPELDIGFRVGLKPNPDPDAPELTGSLGFLDMAMEDGDDLSALRGGFTTDLTAPDDEQVCEPDPISHCTARINVADIPGLEVRDVLLPQVGGVLDTTLALESGISVPGSDTDDLGKKLPKVFGDFIFKWELSKDIGGGSDAARVAGAVPPKPVPPKRSSIRDLPKPEIKFENVSIDPGSIFAQTLNPAFRGLQRFTKPVDPIREFIFSPIPVISDLSKLFGGADISFVDLAERFGKVNLSLLRDINGLLDFIGTLPTAEGERIEIGDFTIAGEDATGPPATPDQARRRARPVGTIRSIQDQAFNAVKTNTAAGAASKAKLTRVVAGNAGGGVDTTPDVTIPILKSPGCVFGMLMGGDCDLFRYTPDPFQIRFDYEQNFGPFFGLVYVTVGGYASALGRIDVGYDTSGIRELIQAIKADPDSAPPSAGSLFDGVFIGDLDPETGEDVNELEVQAGISAGAKLSAIIAEAGVRGGVDATVGLNLHDGPDVDGKLRIDEIRRKIAVPFCLFDVNGRLSAYLEAYLKVGLGPLSVKKTFELARVILLDFSEGFCPPTEPELASSSGTALLLNVGTRDGSRGTGWTNADLDNGGSENYVVRQTAAEAVDITAFGFTKHYDNVKSVSIPDAGDGDDSLLFQGLKEGGRPGEAVAATPGTEVPFTLPVTGALGTGNDSIRTGTGADSVSGGGDADSIDLGDGADTGAGDAGTDTILGGSGADTLRGGNDGDHVDGGLGADRLEGGAGDDDVDGGRDLNGPGSMLTNAEGRDGDDVILGGTGADALDGGSGNDRIHGDEELSTDVAGADAGGDDLIAGGSGTDTVFAGAGADRVFGNSADEGAEGVPADDSRDDLHGNGGADVLRGQLGGDDIAGGPDADQAFGAAGADSISGNGGADVLDGGDDIDTIHGNAGDDDVLGQAGDDQLFGDGDADSVFGAGGADDIDGGTGNDRQADGGGLFGDDDDDDIVGGAGQDDLFGGSGVDIELGDEGTIDDSHPAARVASPKPATGSGDRLFGDNAADELYGEGGDDELSGGPDGDLQFGNDGADTVLGQTGADRLIGGSAASDAPDAGDQVLGGTEDDVLLGDNGTIAPAMTFVLGTTGVAGASGPDTLNGGPGEDVLHGQDGDDTEYGGPEFDRMFGDLGADRMLGEEGADVMLGDQGTVARGLGADPGGAPIVTTLLESPDAGGIDTMDGGPADDQMYGGAADDILSGGFADDRMEGNAGVDSMYGASATASDGTAQASDALDALYDGQDDMIGGSSPVNPAAVDADSGERIMRGDGAQDVMTGDNATITRASANGSWLVDAVTLGVKRDVVLLDTEKRGAVLTAVGGGDLILGNDSEDRLYGESGTDTVKGNAGQDYAEGNQDSDWIEGNDDQDDLIGGSAAGGQPDDTDYLHGGGAADVMTGDNAAITRDAARPGGPYQYETDRLEIPAKRWVKLYDLAAPAVADVAGADQLSGGAGADVLFGQDEADYESGGSEDDYMEGNGDTDRQWGDQNLTAAGAPAVIAALATSASAEPQLSGPLGADGQDDQIGGSSIKGHRDTGDLQWGDGGADFQLGDNGRLLRRLNLTRTQYLTYEDANATTLQRQADRFDVAGAASARGDDDQHGGTGDDYQWGQDGADVQYGDADNDDQYGELGADVMFGGGGEDAMIGDRGVITDDRILASDADDPKEFTYKTNGPAFVTYTAFRSGELHRFTDIKDDGDGDMDGDGKAVEKPGITDGGADYMRGGDGHDSIHGAFGDDVANGDSDGDFVYGDDGSDALWGGRGNPDPAKADDRGANDRYVDYLFGGHGGDPKSSLGVATAGADILDYRPRAGRDPSIWFAATNTDVTHPGTADDQSSHGVDWIYGGFDRDVLQANLGANGPDAFDRLFDWAGAYNLYTHCFAAYGGDSDVRAVSPAMIELMERLAFGTGAGTSLADTRSSTSSAFRELGLVYTSDMKNNTGSAYPTTPGNFEQAAC